MLTLLMDGQLQDSWSATPRHGVLLPEAQWSYHHMSCHANDLDLIRLHSGFQSLKRFTSLVICVSEIHWTEFHIDDHALHWSFA